MIKIHEAGGYAIHNRAVPASRAEGSGGKYTGGNGMPLSPDTRAEAKTRTITYKILQSHHIKDENSSAGSLIDSPLRLRFDCLTSHDITYVGIIQTIRASRKDYSRFPMPYVLSNCHNSLCAVGGTINADDHAFGLSAAQKYGGVFVPPHRAVIHQYMREMAAGCGKMILGSDSHTRYGALGTMGIGEGGGELAKQLLGRTYDITFPEVVGVCLTGSPLPGVGPQDVALALIGKVFPSGFVKNKVLEFFGEGVGGLSVDFRNGIDVMTTETACLSSVWVTDGKVEEYLTVHGRGGDYLRLCPGEAAYYDGLIELDLSGIRPMIALPFHPSNTFEIGELNKNASDIIAQLEKAEDRTESAAAFSLRNKLSGGRLRFDQGIIAGCAGGLYENILAAASILEDGGAGMFPLSVYPASQPVYYALSENGALSRLTRAGAVVKTAFCGPCFGAGDIPANHGLSARHTTRNFPNREGSKPGNGQSAGVALMDARSVAATAKNGGLLTAASEADGERAVAYFFDKSIYENNVYDGTGKPDADTPLILGPGIRDWPALQELSEDLLLSVAAFITDPVTTTDELIPSGETSSYRSNPLALAEFTLSRKDPGYVARAKAAAEPERSRLAEEMLALDNRKPWARALDVVKKSFQISDHSGIGFGSLIYAAKPGDGSAREQAASCQRVLGGLANIAGEYATKRYRSNLVNWGLLPFIVEGAPVFALNDYIFIPGIREAVERREQQVTAYVVREDLIPFTLLLPGLTAGEAEILLKGGLINYYGN